MYFSTKKILVTSIIKRSGIALEAKPRFYVFIYFGIFMPLLKAYFRVVDILFFMVYYVLKL